LLRFEVTDHAPTVILGIVATAFIISSVAAAVAVALAAIAITMLLGWFWIRRWFRFWRRSSGERVVCGVTTYALKYCDPNLPHHGLLPAKVFISAFKKLMSISSMRRGPNMRMGCSSQRA
jgi:hypothetical protein